MKRSESETSAARAARILAAIRHIPHGRVATYGQIAALAGLPGRARLVGRVLRDSADAAAVPWQRVINASGEISSRGGLGWEEGLQRALLLEEDVAISAGGRIDLKRWQWQPRGPRLALCASGSGSARTRGGGSGSTRVRGSDSGSARARGSGSGSARVRGSDNGGARGSGSTLAERVVAIEALLAPLGNAARARGAKAYLKSDLEFLGVATDPLRAAARTYAREHPELAGRALRSLVRALWRRPVHELRAFAIELLLPRVAELESSDLPLLESLLRRSGSWAYVDVIAIHLVGPLVERHPELAKELDRWAVDSDFWIRRSALLALLLPLRHGGGDWPRFTRYADAMLDEQEFFIRKAIGWVLREVGKTRPRLVTAFLAPRLARVSGVTRREAVRYLPAADRARLGLAD